MDGVEYSDPSLSQLLRTARRIGGVRRADDAEMAIRAAIIAGDLAEIAQHSGTSTQRKRLLGELILSAVRWADDLGYGAAECVNEATRPDRG